MENNSEQSKYKRKRKKTFLKNARKYAKKGCYGRGSELNAESCQNYITIMETYREGFDSEESKKIFVDSVFQGTENEEINCSCNQVGCRVVETLLPFADDSVLERYMKAFAEELRPLCTDRFASHVLEALLTQCCLRSINKNNKNKDKFKEFTIKITKFLLNNLEDFIWDTYANHIIRSACRNFAQIPKDEVKSDRNKQIQQNIEHVDILEEYTDILKEFADRLLMWPQFNDLPYTEITSGMLQVLLKALAKVNVKKLKKYVKQLLDGFCPSSSIENQTIEHQKKWPDIFMSKPGLMLLEVMIEVTIPKYFTQIYVKCFQGHIHGLAMTRNTNFAVQKLLTHCSEKVEFEAMFDELSEHFEEIISTGHTGVILALAQTCKRLVAKQGSFVQNMMKALHCEPEERQNTFLICLCKFVAFEELKKLNISNYEKEKFNLHGTLILQSVLEFNKPIKLVNALLNMETNDLKCLFSNTMGSHIADSCVTSKFIGEKSREKLIRKLQGTYQDLASTKYGSRSFDAIWNVCNQKFKMNIMDELAHKDAAWSNSDCGRIIARKVNLTLYKKSKEEWKNACNNVNKIKELQELLK